MAIIAIDDLIEKENKATVTKQSQTQIVPIDDMIKREKTGGKSYSQRAYENFESKLEKENRIAKNLALGAFEGYTSGLVRGGVEKATGYEIPKGEGVAGLVGQTVGMIAGPGKFIKPIAKLAKGKKWLAAMLGGATAGAVISPDDPFDVKARAGQAAGGALTMGALERTGKYGGDIVKKLAGVPTKTIKRLRELGVKKVFDPRVEQVDYIGKDLVPKVQDVVAKNIEKLEPKTLQVLGVPNNIISKARLIGKDKLFQNYKQYDGSTAPIVEKVQQGLNRKIQSANKQFSDVMKNVPDDFEINIGGFRGKLGGILKREGIINKKGEVVTVPGDLHRTLKGLLNIYGDVKKRVRLNIPKRIEKLRSTPEIKLLPGTRMVDGKQVGGGALGVGDRLTGKIDPSARRLLSEAKASTDRFTKSQYVQFKNNLQGMFSGDAKFDRLVQESIDDLDAAAIRSGIKGLSGAKKAYKLAKENEKKFLDKFTKVGERKLEKIGLEKLTAQESSELSNLEKYIDMPFVKDVRNLNIAKALEDKISVKLNTDIVRKGRVDADDLTKMGEWIQGKLESAQNLKNTQARNTVKRLVGNYADDLQDLLDANRISQELSTKGIYSSGAGIAKGGARYAIKGYEEKLRPLLKRYQRALPKEYKPNE